jgi:hypothetical protein
MLIVSIVRSSNIVAVVIAWCLHGRVRRGVPPPALVDAESHHSLEQYRPPNFCWYLFPQLKLDTLRREVDGAANQKSFTHVSPHTR